ncbi:MAG: hypothetical protein RR710_05295 [Oscillospiraceae bacterium]
MTLGELKTTVLKLLDEKARADILERFNNFFNIGQLEIATTCGFIIKNFNIEHLGGTKLYDMPQDFYIAQGIYLIGEKGNLINTNDFIWQGEKRLALTKKGNYQVVYKAYPKAITDETKDDFNFEIPLIAQHALPFYVAAQVCATDERDKYVGFLQQYQSKLVNLMEIGRTKTRINIDLRGAVYGI